MNRMTAAMILGALAVGCESAEEPLAPEPQLEGAENVIIKHPEEGPGPPFYSLIQPGWFPMTDDWAAVPWFRDPNCVPPAFNILQFIDPPPTPFFCTLMISAVEIWNTDPPDPSVGPLNISFKGMGAVPIYFAHRSEVTAAMQDGVLTVGELQALPSLRVGYADRFSGAQQTGVARGRSGQGKINISAHGRLTDGTPFFFQTAEGPPRKGPIAHTSIEFR